MLKSIQCAAITLGLCLTVSAQSAPRTQDYFRDMVSLAETLGKAHATRVVCNGNGDQYWRRYMISILELEAPYENGLRRSLIDAFNAGFSTATAATPSCGQAATQAEKQYAAEGEALTHRLATANIPGASLPD